MNPSLDQLETKVAFLEQANTELSDVVYRQSREIDALRMQLAELVARLDASESAATAPQDERPPHY